MNPQIIGHNSVNVPLMTYLQNVVSGAIVREGGRRLDGRRMLFVAWFVLPLERAVGRLERIKRVVT